ncbi:MAG: hypothetical protein HZB73_06845 [Nitrosarchaeum sp.]|nr:hypothetical protein [Nitrosarchaeum sp.]
MRAKITRFLTLISKLKDLSSIGIADLVTKGVSSIFWFYMATLLTTEEYGSINYFIATASIVSVISLIGSTNAITVYSAKKVNIRPAMYILTSVFSVVSSIVLFLMFYNVGLSLLIVGYVIAGLVTSELLGVKFYTKYAKYLMLQNGSMVLLAILFYHMIGVNGVVVGIALSHFAYLPRIIKEFRGAKIDFTQLKPRFSFIMNSYILTLSSVFSSSLDRLIVAPLLGFSLLGNYSLGIQFLNLLNILPNIVFKYVLPQDASGISNVKLKRYTVMISFGALALGVIVSPILVPAFFPKFSSAVDVIQIVSFSTIPYAINQMLISKFLGIERSRIVLIGSGIFIAVQLSGIFALGSIYGIKGVAVAFVLAFSAQCAFLLIVNQMHNKKNRST